MINRFFTTTFTVKRMTWSGESSSEVAQVGFSGHIQQASMDLVRNTSMAYTRAFIIWCPVGTDIVIGDTIQSGSDTYSIKSINKRQYGKEQHMQIIAEKDEIA